MNEDGVTLATRIFESSPVVVLILLLVLAAASKIISVLWSRNLERTQLFEEASVRQQNFNTALMREVLTAFNNNTTSHTELKRAVEANTEATRDLKSAVERMRSSAEGRPR
jgi:hypothetical protein